MATRAQFGRALANPRVTAVMGISMQDDIVIVSHQCGWSQLTLNRPEKLNPLSDDMHRSLTEALSEAVVDESCRAVLLTGRGRGFCSGQDLRERDPRLWREQPDLTRTVQQKYNPLMNLIRNVPKPVICAVNGLAAGAGIGLALSCDIVLAAESAVFHLAFARIGLVPDSGTSWHLTQRLGEARARALVMTGGSLSAREAADLGLIWKCVPDDSLLSTAQDLVGQLAVGSATALALSKRTMNSASANNLEQQLEFEARMQGEAGRSPDYAEGVLAFLERRSARFRGGGGSRH